jgi:hypothetical protein
MNKPTYEELEAKCASQASKLKMINKLTGIIEQASYVVKSEIKTIEARCAALAAENATLKVFVKTCFRAAADGASLDGADIHELGERLELFGRETYQPALHGYICGHEAGEDTVYVMKKTPATDVSLAEVRASAIRSALDDGSDYLDTDCVMDRLDISYEDAELRTAGAIELHDSLIEFAAQLRQEAKPV